MAVYKVIQDIEAEDKLLGPLTFKGLVYAGIAGICAFIEFKLIMIGSPVKWVFISVLALPMALFGVLASPLGREQPTEVWLLSRIRYFLKPRMRIWDQEGMSEFVTITAPKKQEVNLTNNLNQTEVHSRLKTLAMTLDTRGWAIKNVDVNMSPPEIATKINSADSDRLIDTAKLPQQALITDVQASDDILDEKNNATAKKFDTLVKQADAKRKHGILSALKGMTEEDLPKHKDKKSKHARHAKSTKELPATKAAVAKVKVQSAAEKARQQAEWEAQIAEKLAAARTKFGADFEQGHKKADPAHHVVGGITRNLPPKPAIQQPVTPQPKLDAPQSDYQLLRSGFGAGQAAADKMTSINQTDKMNLAQSGNAFSVATVSQLANRQAKIQQSGPDEVTISLH